VSKDKGLVFYEGSHRYKLDGEWVPGVTTILGILDKPAIPKWAATQVAEFVANHPDLTEQMKQLGGVGPTVAFLKNLPWEKRDTAAVRGTDVHNIAERIVHGDQVEVPEHLVGYVESALAFMDDYGIEPVLVEACIGSRAYNYAGKLDLIADSKRGPTAIYDYKTTASGIYATTAWQNAAYAFAEFYNTDLDGKTVEDALLPLHIEASFGVHLRDDGYSVHRLEFGPHVFREFLNIRAAYEANKRAVGNWRVPGSGYVGISEQSEASA
jgi:hypothetical protein